MSDLPQIFFAWVDPTETTFTLAHERFDEWILDLTIEQKEGHFATAEIEIKNPNRGLLNGKVWAWISWSDGITTTPLFFGHVVAIPSRSTGTLVRVQLIARPSDYIARRQAFAQTLKTLPQYDPVFFEPAKRDDPEAIIEGWSGLYHTDRVTHAVSLSDVLIGEDGTLNFTSSGGDFALYDGFNLQFGQPPRTAISLVATVQWTQATYGVLPLLNETFSSYTGKAIKDGWPKPGQGLGGGWEALHSWALDLNGNEQAYTANLTYHYTNKDKTHNTGDTMSISMGSTLIFGGKVGHRENIFQFIQGSILNPFNQDAVGNPDPINQPLIIRLTDMAAMLWDVGCGMSMRYDAKRSRRERVAFTLTADVQPFMIDPTISQVTEAITINGSDLGEPLIDLQAWTDFVGQAVPLGTVIFPNDPQIPGQTSAQIAISAGIAGATEPIFSNVPGQTTFDGSVIWASLGDAGPQQNPPGWTPFLNVALGMVAMPRVPLALPFSAIQESYLANYPPTPVPIEYGQYICYFGDAAYPDQYQGIFVCTQSGALFSTFPDRAPVLQAVQARGKDLFIVTQGGQTGEFLPVFDFTPGAVTNDGSVQWTCIGEVAAPIGGWPGNTPASAYFPTARGLQSLEHLFCRARAKLRYAARFAQVSFKGSWERGINLTCRMNAFLDDPRLPGGNAGGKVIAYKLRASKGAKWCEVEIGCSCGNAGAVALTPGEPTYVDEDYIDPDYQVYSGAVVPIGDDIGYTPPVAAVVDDGLVFPLLSTSDVIIKTETLGTLDDQIDAIKLGFAQARKTANENATLGASANLQDQLRAQQDAHTAGIFNTAYYLGQAPIWFEMSLRPVQNGPFFASYAIQTQPLAIPKTIDLSAGPV